MACRMKYNPMVGGYTRICSPKRKKSKSLMGGIGDIGELGAFTSFRSTLAGIKPVLLNGAVAAGGAIITDKLFTKLDKEVINKDKVRISGIPLHLLEITTGLALGLIIGKVTRKPALAAMLAIGPVMVGTLRIFGELLGQPSLSGISPVGMMSIEPYRETYSGVPALAAPNTSGAWQIGPGVPNWMLEPKGEFAGVEGYQ